MPITHAVTVNDATTLPFGVRVTLVVDRSVDFKFGDGVSLLLEDGLVLKVHLSRTLSIGGRELRYYEADLVAFGTANEAELAGSKLAVALLWAAISARFPAVLAYSGQRPYVVHDRRHPGWVQAWGSGMLSMPVEAQQIQESVSQIVKYGAPEVPGLAVSLELFAAANLELSERARFVGLVSAVEPLACQQRYGEPIAPLIAAFRSQLRNTRDVAEDVRASLDGRIADLTRESVRLAIKRVMSLYLPADPAALRIIDEAYKARSAMLHDGLTVDDLPRRSAEVEDVLRLVYSAILGQRLSASTPWAAAAGVKSL